MKIPFHLLKTKTFADIAVVLAGNIVSVLLGFVFVAITARWLGPSGFGIYSTIMAFATFLSAVIDIGISQSLVKFVGGEREEKEKKIWISTSFALVAGVSFGLSVAATIIYDVWLRHVWNHSENYSMLAFFTIWVITLNIFLLALFQSIGQFIKRVLVDNLFSIIRLLLVGVFILTAVYSVSLAVTSVILAYTLTLLFGVWLGRRWLGKKEVDLQKSKTIFGFSGWLAGTSLFANLYGKLDVLMLAWLTTSYQTGIYAAAARFMTIFPLVVSSLSSVVAPRLAGFQNHSEVQGYFKKILGIVVFVIGAMLFLIVIADYLITYAFGAQYGEAVRIFRYLVIAFIPLLVAIPATNSIIYYFKKPQWATLVSFIQMTGMFLTNLYFIPLYGAFGVVLSFAIMNSIGMVAYYGFYFYAQSRKKN